VNEVLYPPLQFVKESVVSDIYLDIIAYQSNPKNSLQFHGTALPSLALEYLQEVDNLKLSGSDQEEAEETIAKVLASLYSGT